MLERERERQEREQEHHNHLRDLVASVRGDEAEEEEHEFGGRGQSRGRS